AYFFQLLAFESFLIASLYAFSTAWRSSGCSVSIALWAAARASARTALSHLPSTHGSNPYRSMSRSRARDRFVTSEESCGPATSSASRSGESLSAAICSTMSATAADQSSRSRRAMAAIASARKELRTSRLEGRCLPFEAAMSRCIIRYCQAREDEVLIGRQFELFPHLSRIHARDISDSARQGVDPRSRTPSLPPAITRKASDDTAACRRRRCQGLPERRSGRRLP